MIRLAKSILRPLARPIKIQLRRRKISQLSRQKPLKVILGSGYLEYEGWICTDIDTLNVLKPSEWNRYFALGDIDAMLSEHMWEHLTPEEAVEAAKLCCAYLKTGKRLRAAVPDGYHPDPEYIEWVKPGGNGLGSDDHKVLYNYRSFAKVFEDAGFTVELLEYYDENGEFHFKEWDKYDGFVRRSKRYDATHGDDRPVGFTYTSLILDAFKPESS